MTKGRSDGKLTDMDNSQHALVAIAACKPTCRSAGRALENNCALKRGGLVTQAAKGITKTAMQLSTTLSFVWRQVTYVRIHRTTDAEFMVSGSRAQRA